MGAPREDADKVGAALLRLRGPALLEALRAQSAAVAELEAALDTAFQPTRTPAGARASPSVRPWRLAAEGAAEARRLALRAPAWPRLHWLLDVVVGRRVKPV